MEKWNCSKSNESSYQQDIQQLVAWTCFPKNKSEETIIKWGEKLRNVKDKGTCYEIFNPSCMNEMSESNAGIRSGLKLESSKLALIDEVVQHHMKLESITNDFLDKFS